VAGKKAGLRHSRSLFTDLQIKPFNRNVASVAVFFVADERG